MTPSAPPSAQPLMAPVGPITLATSRVGFPCCSLFLVGMPSPTTPAKWLGLVVRSSVQPCQPSPGPGRVGLRIVSFGAASVFTHVTACQLADSLSLPPFSQAPAASLPSPPLGYVPRPD